MSHGDLWTLRPLREEGANESPNENEIFATIDEAIASIGAGEAWLSGPGPKIRPGNFMKG